MKAVVVRESGPVLEDRAEPVPRPNEVLVQVKAAALNRLDMQVADGATHGKSGGVGNTMGIEWSGVVLQVGDEVPRSWVSPGDRVMCSGTGGYAEMAKTDWGRVHKFPDSFVDFNQAAALPVALQTAHEAITASGQFQRGQTVLVNGASSVIGMMSMQVAKALGAAQVIGTTVSSGRIEALRPFGLDLGVATDQNNWVEAVLAATQGRGVDLTIDMVAGPTLNALLLATRVAGRIVNVGRVGGFHAEVDLDLHAMRRIQYIGASFRTRTLDEVREVSRNMRLDLWEAVAREELRIPVSDVFPLERFAEAIETMRGNRHFGKIILSV